MRSLLEHINKGALILAVLEYFGFAWFDELSDKGHFDIPPACKYAGNFMNRKLVWIYHIGNVAEYIWTHTNGYQPHRVSRSISTICAYPNYSIKGFPLMIKCVNDFIALIVEKGRGGGFIRPSRRIRIKTPEIDMSEYVAPPPDLILEKTPGYAGRRC